MLRRLRWEINVRVGGVIGVVVVGSVGSGIELVEVP